MKRLTVSISAIFILFAVLVSSCSKSSTASSNSGTVTFNANGTPYSYSAGTGMIGHSTGNSLQFIKNESNNSQNALSFGGGNDASGTYSFSPSTSLQWTINGKAYTSIDQNGNSSGSITVNITGSTSTATFSTTLYNVSNSTDVVSITNGNFSGSFIAQ